LFLNEILFWEKKRHSKAVKTVRGTSQVLLLMQVFLSRNDLKPENLRVIKLLYFLSCVVIAFGKGCQEIMDVQSQLLFIGSSA